MSDGRIIFNSKIDNSGIEKDLRDLERKIRKSNEAISKAENEKLPLVKQLDEAKKMLDKARAALAGFKADLSDTQSATKSKDPAEAMAATAVLPEARAMVAAQEKEVEKLQKNWATINDRVAGYDRKIQQAKTDIERNNAKAGELAAQLNSGGVKMQAAFDKARNSANRFGKRLLEIAKGALVFNVVSSILRGVVNYMGKVLKSNSEYTAQLAKLKGALLTAFQPIYEFVLPGVLAVMRVLTAIAQVVANILSFLFGKTASESAKNAEALYKEADAIDAVGGAAKKAQKSLARFDEINTVGGNNDNGGSGGSAIAPVFADDQSEEMKVNLERIGELVAAIAAGFLAWKIAAPFSGILKTVAGLVLAIGGALYYGTNMADAFINGISWDNLTGMLLGLVAVVGGLGLAFGLTAAAVALLIGGIGLVIVSFNEWMMTGELSTEACAALTAGIIAIGGAISLLTGSWIPLVIAAVVSLVLALATKGDEIKGLLQKFDDWLQGVFAKDWTEVFGPVLGSVLNGFFGVVKNVWSGVKKILDGIIDFVGAVFKGDWQKAWDSIVSIFRGAWESIGAIFQPIIDLIADAWTGLGELLPDTWKNAINSVVAVVNKFLSWLNDTLTFDIPPIKIAGISIFKGGSVSLINLPPIPYLAKGAVIPPNAPFMAMLGDQRHGTNIEAPLSTIQEAVAMVMQDYSAANLAGHEATVAVLREILEAVLGIEIGDKVIADAVQRYNSRMAVVRGG